MHTKTIAVLARQLPDSPLGLVIDSRTVIKRPRYGRDGYARNFGQIFESDVFYHDVY